MLDAIRQNFETEATCRNSVLATGAVLAGGPQEIAAVARCLGRGRVSSEETRSLLHLQAFTVHLCQGPEAFKDVLWVGECSCPTVLDDCTCQLATAT